MPDLEYARAFNAVLSVIVIVFGLVALWLSTRTPSIYVAAYKYADRVGLPFGTEAVHEAVMERMRSLAKAEALVPLMTGAVSLALVATPLGVDPLYSVIVLVPVFLVTATLTLLVESLGERLFHPSPHSQRVARLRVMRAADYVGPFRRLLPWVLAVAAVCAAAALVIARDAWRPDPGVIAPVAVTTFIAVIVMIAVPRVERVVLNRPQPASDQLELAWDDAFRARALTSLRQVLALAWWFALALSINALPWSSEEFWVQPLPLWGMIALQLVYLPPRLPGSLRPAQTPAVSVQEASA